MLPSVLRRLEALQADLDTIDPAREADAADRVADLARSLSRLLGAAGVLPTAERAETAAFDGA